MTPELPFIQNLIQEAGQLILSMKKTAKTSFKSAKDIVTEADFACEALLVERIQKEYPHDYIISEENYSQFTLTDERTWVMDPIDGTVNYSHNIPLYGISIALVQNKEVILGVIYLPEMDELYWAEKGKGAFCNNEALQVSKVSSLETSIIYYADFNCKLENNPHNQNELTELKNLAGKVMRTRVLGSCVVETAYVASGRVEGQISNGYFWDIAAGKVIVEEAGGKVSQKNGDAYDPLKRDSVLSNGKIHEPLLKSLNER